MKSFLFLFLVSAVATSFCEAQEVLFYDDFDGIMDEEWVMPDGGWEVIDGRLQITAGGYLYSGGEFQNDYLVSFDFQIDGQPYYGTVGCFIAINNMPLMGTSGYFLGLGLTQDQFDPMHLIIARIDDGSWNQLVYVESEIPTGIQHIKLGREGTEMVVKHWSDGEDEPIWQLSVVDDTYHSGLWMPSITGFSGWIDNFLVEGYGTVSTEQSSWGGVKALYR
jgi:hypothetical protein